MKMKDVPIYNYFNGNTLLIENIVNDFSNYIYTVIRNSNLKVSDEDIEELISDVVFTIWKNQDKLDINRKITPYIAGITKNLVKKKYWDTKVFDNIEDYENNLKELPKTKHIKLNNIYKEMVLYRIISLFNIYELFNKLSNSII